MKLPILTLTLILCLTIAFFNRRSKEQSAAEENEFWDKELAANNTRRKSLDNLNYITIPLDKLPIDKHLDNDNIRTLIDTIVELSKSPIVNLTGISNTDLKLQYGAPNIDILSTYDSRYTMLASSLNKWGQALYEADDITAAKTVLEFAISTKTDISGTYKTLAKIYQSEGNSLGVDNLRAVAETLNTPMKASIIDFLTEIK